MDKATLVGMRDEYIKVLDFRRAAYEQMHGAVQLLDALIAEWQDAAPEAPTQETPE